MNDQHERELRVLLQLMLEEDAELSARNVVRRSAGVLKHASEFTRNKRKREVLAEYQVRQAHVRSLARKIEKTGKAQLTARLAAAEEELRNLREERKLLIDAVRGVIYAVGVSGGMRAWREFYPRYSNAFRALSALGVIPASSPLEEA